MADLATLSDLIWRPLNPQETTNATAWLGEASAIVRNRVPSVDTKIGTDPDYAAVVRGRVAEAVVRALRGAAPNDRATYGGIFFYESDWADIEGPSGVSRTVSSVVLVTPYSDEC